MLSSDSITLSGLELKTPSGSLQMSGEDLFKTPVKTPRKTSSIQMSGEDVSKTPVKTPPKTSSIQKSGNNLLKTPVKTPRKTSANQMSREDSFKTPVKTPLKTSSNQMSGEDFSKTPRKMSLLQMSGGSNDLAVSDPKTPVKTPRKTPSIREEVAFDLFKTPGKTPRKTPGKDTSGDSWSRKTPLNKFKKKSPMPSPFLLSPGTPSKDISIASISFNQNEHFMVTPSVQDPYDENSLTLEISPSGSLHTPSPQSQDRDDPLITPPLDEVTTPDNTYGKIDFFLSK